MSTKPPTYHIAITRRADGGRAVIEVGDYIELRDALNDIIARATDSGWFTPSGQPRRRGHPGGRNALPRRRNGSPKEQQSP